MSTTLVLHPKQAEKLAGMTKAMTLHEWMTQTDGLCFFRVPIKPKDTATLAAMLLQYPEHRLETREEWLGVLRA